MKGKPFSSPLEPIVLIIALIILMAAWLYLTIPAMDLSNLNLVGFAV